MGSTPCERLYWSHQRFFQDLLRRIRPWQLNPDVAGDQGVKASPKLFELLVDRESGPEEHCELRLKSDGTPGKLARTLLDLCIYNQDVRCILGYCRVYVFFLVDGSNL